MAVVVKSGDCTLDETAIIRALDQRLAKYKCPKRVLFAASLPRNAMGKVLKNELRETHKGLYALKRTG